MIDGFFCTGSACEALTPRSDISSNRNGWNKQIIRLRRQESNQQNKGPHQTKNQPDSEAKTEPTTAFRALKHSVHFLHGSSQTVDFPKHRSSATSIMQSPERHHRVPTKQILVTYPLSLKTSETYIDGFVTSIDMFELWNSSSCHPKNRGLRFWYLIWCLYIDLSNLLKMIHRFGSQVGLVRFPFSPRVLRRGRAREKTRSKLKCYIMSMSCHEIKSEFDVTWKMTSFTPIC